MMKDRRSKVSSDILLVQSLERINTTLEQLKGLLQSVSNTGAITAEHIIGLRAEIKKWEEETLQTRSWRNDLEIQALEDKNTEYEKELDKVQQAQRSAKKALDAIRIGRGNTTEKMKAIARGTMEEDKIDLRVFKVSSRQFTYLLIAIVTLIILLIFMLPDTVAQILLRLAGMIGSP